MKDVMDKVGGDRTVLDKILEAIPGYKSYSEAEERRDADKIQREYLANKMDQGKNSIDDVKEELLSNGVLDGLEDLDNISKLIERNANRIRYASYGMSGLFDTVKITNEDLEKMHAFDLALIESVNSVLESLKKLGGLEGSDLKKEIRGMKSTLEKFNQDFDQRGNMIKGVE
ncbi:hypothetical protein ACFL35_00235 [Candidatus Riflebacteria bacterium]